MDIKKYKVIMAKVKYEGYMIETPTGQHYTTDYAHALNYYFSSMEKPTTMYGRHNDQMTIIRHKK